MTWPAARSKSGNAINIGSVSTPSENEKKKEKEGEKVSNLLPPLILSAAPPGARRGMKLIIILF